MPVFVGKWAVIVFVNIAISSFSTGSSINERLLFDLDAFHLDLQTIVVRDVTDQRTIKIDDFAAVAQRFDSQ